MLLSACGSTTAPSSTPTTTARPSPTTTTPAPPSTTPAVRTVNWFDLDVGECLADPPPVDPNVIAVAVVDCETPHHAEVYLRVPLAVNTAIAEVANRKCNDGFTAYTGEPVGSGTFSVAYLIDSQSKPHVVQPGPEHRNLPAAVGERWTAGRCRPADDHGRRTQAAAMADANR